MSEEGFEAEEFYHLYKNDAPETSKEAARSINPTHLEKIIYETICQFKDGCISDEVRSYCKKVHGIEAYSSVTARFKALKEKGLIEYAQDEEGKAIKRPGQSGRNQYVMVKKEPHGTD